MVSWVGLQGVIVVFPYHTYFSKVLDEMAFLFFLFLSLYFAQLQTNKKEKRGLEKTHMEKISFSAMLVSFYSFNSRYVEITQLFSSLSSISH